MLVTELSEDWFRHVFGAVAFGKVVVVVLHFHHLVGVPVVSCVLISRGPVGTRLSIRSCTVSSQ